MKRNLPVIEMTKIQSIAFISSIYLIFFFLVKYLSLELKNIRDRTEATYLNTTYNTIDE